MRHRSGQSRSPEPPARRLVRGCACVLLIVLAAPAGAAAAPAVDEYTLDLPDAEGPRRSGPAPTPRPSELPPEIAAQLSGPEDAPLVSAATARELGAPPSNGGKAEPLGVETGGGSLVEVAAGASGEDEVLPLLAVLAAIGGIAGVVAVRRHRTSAGRD